MTDEEIRAELVNTEAWDRWSKATARWIQLIVGYKSKADELATELAEVKAERESLLTTIRYVEHIVGDEFCFDLDARIHVSDEPNPTMTEAEVRLAQEKFSDVYKAVHSADMAHACYYVHDDWRKEVAGPSPKLRTDPDAIERIEGMLSDR